MDELKKVEIAVARNRRAQVNTFDECFKIVLNILFIKTW